jgi:hypothetical protein
MRWVQRLGRFAFAPFMLALVVLANLQGAGAGEATPDFRQLHVLAQLANVSYGGTDAIMGKALAKQSRAYVSVPGDTQVKYFLGFNDARKVQVVGVRGTVNEVNWSLNRDRRGVSDPASGAILHAGFKRAADALYADLKPRLKPGYRTYLVGHSLGGAVAAILGIYLQRDGWPVERVVTFGQPRFTDVRGATAFAALPLVRVVNQNDIVPLLPDTIAGSTGRFVQFGTAVVVFPGPYYALVPAGASWAAEGAFRRYLLQASLPDHAMRFYEENLRGKDRRAERVNFADRERYIVRRWPNRFPPGAPGTPERRQNFVSGLGR